MTHTYQISGMTCGGCESKVRDQLFRLPDVTGIDIDLAKGTADITMAQHISTATLQSALKDYPKYQLTETAQIAPEEQKSWVATYKPILLIFGYVTTVALLAGGFQLLPAMRIFMAGFFLVFSFFKMLGLQGFAESYAMYDIVAKKFRAWGYIYAFVELALGLAYAANFQPIIVSYITLVVMSVSIIGVLQSVLNKRKIKCACLGAVFNLPMSTVTIIEDALMIAMSVAMLLIMQ
jgi:copper chaperone CopZ